MRKPFLRGTSKENGIQALKNVISAPITGRVNVGEPPNWAQSFKEASSSKLLWFHSLPFVGDLLTAWADGRDPVYLDKLFHLLGSYLEWLAKKRGGPAWKDDHAVANRGRMLAYILYASRADGFVIPDNMLALIDKALHRHGAWLRNDAHYISNNHGLMADRALIEITLSPSSIPESVVQEWQAHALSRLNKMLEHTFDEDGCCVENSPAYHVLNLSLFRAVVELLQDNAIATDKTGFVERIEKAEAICHLFFRKDGTFPIIGDTELHPTQWVDLKKYSPKEGMGIFPKSGFFIYKSERLYVTAKCGGDSYFHRHSDETSITLNVDGYDFLMDAGYYNYDWNKKGNARDIRSYLGHSGIFTDQCEFVRPRRFKRPRVLGKISELAKQSDIWRIQMESYLDRKSSIGRRVFCADENTILISDAVSSKRATTARQQFIIHPKCSLEVSGNTVRIERSNTVLEIEISSNQCFEIAVEDCVISEKFMEIETAKRVVAVARAKNVVFNAKIDILDA